MNKFKKIALALGMSVLSAGTLVAVVAPEITFAATITSSSKDSDCSASFLTFPTWYRGLVHVKQTTPGTYECVINQPKSGELSPFIWHIVLNCIEIGLQIVGYLTAGFILWGGFLFLTSQGSPDAAAKARKTILDATIGLGISIASIAVINLLSGILIHNP
ncbi:MAG: hypothetical protein JWN26_138 [Candidatus Saccharibacteria bacterium]|nr:hypothetical protein [Candidatus Saccharibacteria bacterium]